MLFLITLYLLPKSNREFESVKYSMKNSITNVLLRNDDSFNNFKNITIYTKDVNNDILSSLVIYIKGDKGEQDRIIHAERGIINGDNILLTNGNIQESGSDNGDHIKILFFKKYALNITEYYGLDTGGKFSEKLMYLHELAEIKNKSQKTKAEITKRVIIPLFSIVLAILSVTLMLNINFTRMENGRRLFKNYLICIVVFSTFFYSLDILERSIHGAVVMVLLLVFSITYSFIKLREDRILT
jgi:lipopolysaccharide export LptBFGC system permease protein LptF